MNITTHILDAIKVQFLEPIFEDDFVERGMKAWLTAVEWSERAECYELFFDFSEFEEENNKYFKATFYPTPRTQELQQTTGRKRFTAKEAGMYNPKYSVFFSIESGGRDDLAFERDIANYLRTVD